MHQGIQPQLENKWGTSGSSMWNHAARTSRPSGKQVGSGVGRLYSVASATSVQTIRETSGRPKRKTNRKKKKKQVRHRIQAKWETTRKHMRSRVFFPLRGGCPTPGKKAFSAAENMFCTRKAIFPAANRCTVKKPTVTFCNFISLSLILSMCFHGPKFTFASTTLCYWDWNRKTKPMMGVQLFVVTLMKS